VTRARQRRAWLGVPLLLVLQAALVGYDLTHSNRPHELRFVWPVALAGLVAAWLTVQAWREACAFPSERTSLGVTALAAVSLATLVSLVLALAGIGTVLVSLVRPLFG